MREDVEHGFPFGSVLSDSKEAKKDLSLPHQFVFNVLKRILSGGKKLENLKRSSLQDQIACFDELLPLVSWSDLSSGEFFCSIACHYRPNCFKFLFDIISSWLLPGRRLNIGMFFAKDFYFIGFEAHIYTACELRLKVEDQEDICIVRNNLSLIEKELRLGISSVYHAQRILDVKGLSLDNKTSMIQEQILSLINNRPQDFDHGLITEMQHFLLTCGDSFKAIREFRHISRIICFHYLFRKSLSQSLKFFSDRRFLHFKCVKARLHLPSKIKAVLGIIVGINFLKSNELLEERHLLKAIKNYIPSISSVEGSFFFNAGRDAIRTMYIEVYKSDDKEFSLDEIKLLRKELPNDFKNSIEHLMHPIFMPCNEEEIIRNILTLSNQIKYLRDIPQVMITFEEQADAYLSFVVIWLRVLRKDSVSLEEKFKSSGSFLKIFMDRTKIIGRLRKKHAKEASVFRVRLKKTPFLRADHSLDLYKARQAIVSELLCVNGEFRDFNGGMISKQNELLCSLKDIIDCGVDQNEFLLENFFYSLNPVVMRTILEPGILKTLFLMLLDALEEGFFKGENYYLKSCEEKGFFLVMVTAVDPSFKEDLDDFIEDMHIPSLDLATSSVNIYDTLCLGYIYRVEKPNESSLLEKQMRDTLDKWEKRFFSSSEARKKSQSLQKEGIDLSLSLF